MDLTEERMLLAAGHIRSFLSLNGSHSWTRKDLYEKTVADGVSPQAANDAILAMEHEGELQRCPDLTLRYVSPAEDAMAE